MRMMATDNLNKTIVEIFDDKYIVPLYQRNFAWGKDEIERLLQDVYENFTSAPDTNYYIGSLVVLRRADSVFEVIDGQQRLTVLSLLTKKLGLNNRPKLMYDSRPEVESFFNAVYNDEDIYALKECDKISHLINAVSAIDESNLCNNTEKDNIVTIDTLGDDERNKLIRYFQNKVILIRTEIPNDTDVASYFEIMNNRGEQLQKHEIVKALMISGIPQKDDQDLFATIWDACSQMDIPIQKLFKTDRRRDLFGKDFDKYTDCIKEQVTSTSFNKHKEHKGPTLKEILNPDFDTNAFAERNDENDEIDTENGLGHKAIIDFPNFLMHVFKLEYNNLYTSIDADQKEIPLNEKYLLNVYNQLKTVIDPLKFINFLLYYRTIFDRYIVRSIDDSNQEDQFRWILTKPKRYVGKNSVSTKYDVNTFEDNSQEFLIKALSMLQVRFRNRIYKEWLYDALYWIAENYGSDINEVDDKKYLTFVQDLMLKHYDTNFDVNDEGKCNFESLGQNTPHFIFFFIDYLYWVAWKKKKTEIANIEMVEDFDFKYWNSVEHHLPQSYGAKGYDNMLIDNLGNLCLVSKNANSRMNNESPIGKASRNGKYYKKGLSPKRKIMYNLTNKDANWENPQIEEHHRNVMLLLEQRRCILDIPDIFE